MPKTLINQFPTEKRIPQKEGCILNIAECFADTLQGENNMGYTSTFLRLQGCTLDCVYCDTLEVWRQGNPYSTEEVLDLFEKSGLIEKFREGQRLVLTGGSPLKQQNGLIDLIQTFKDHYEFIPYIEVENEAVLKIDPALSQYISCWNNSPKLANSGMKERARYRPEAIKQVAKFENSWFKFVVSREEDWEEIQEFYINPGLIRKDQIIIMPEGQTRLELEKTREIAVECAIKHNVRYSDRLHIVIWDKKVGV